VLNTDETVECDMHRMLPEDSDAMFFISRVATVNPVTIENLRKMGPQLGHAASLILPDLPLCAIAYSCTIMLSKLSKSKSRSDTFYKSLAMQVISTRLP